MDIKTVVIKQKKIAEGTYEISFGLLHQQHFTFTAGQYIRVTVPRLLYNDPKGPSRIFTLASSPNEKNRLRIAFRNSGSGFKKTLLESPPGNLMEIAGPFGSLALPQDSSRPLVFIAGGIGITPFLSMIRLIHENKLNYQITLLYANSNKRTAAYLNELAKISRQNPRLMLKNRFGRIDKKFIKLSVKDIDKQIWYIVGAPVMVGAARNMLAHLGIDDKAIYAEDFYGY